MKKFKNKEFWEVIIGTGIIFVTLGINILIVLALIKFIWG